MKNTFLLILATTFVTFLMSSCEMMAPEERPIRPTSENSDLAHGANDSSGSGLLGGALSR